LACLQPSVDCQSLRYLQFAHIRPQHNAHTVIIVCSYSDCWFWPNEFQACCLFGYLVCYFISFLTQVCSINFLSIFICLTIHDPHVFHQNVLVLSAFVFLILACSTNKMKLSRSYNHTN